MEAMGTGGFCFPCEVRDTGNMGLGVFASYPISKGSIVWRHVPGQYAIYDEQMFRARLETMGHDEVVYELTHVFGLQAFPGCLIRIFDDGALINHSRDGNLAINRAVLSVVSLDATSSDYVQNVTRALLDDRHALVAARDIKSGEELTNDYASEIDDPQFYDALCEQYGVTEAYLDDG